MPVAGVVSCRHQATTEDGLGTSESGLQHDGPRTPSVSARATADASSLVVGAGQPSPRCRSPFSVTVFSI